MHNGGIGRLLHEAYEVGLLDEVTQALEFLEAKKLQALFAEARMVLEQQFREASALPPWHEFAKTMGHGALDEQHDGLATRCYDAIQELSALRVAKVRQAPNLFV